MAKALRRHCYSCDKELPLTPKWFAHRARNRPPYSETCRKCEETSKQEFALQVQDTLPSLLQQVQGYSVDLIANEAIRQSNEIPHSAELLESIMRTFGGVENFGKMFAAHFWQCEPGKAQRTKMLMTVASLILKNSEQGGAKKPIDLWTDEELDTEIQRRMNESRTLTVIPLPVHAIA